MTCYLTIKKNEIPMCTSTWMNLESISVSEQSQEEKTYVGFRLNEVLRVGKSYRNRWFGGLR